MTSLNVYIVDRRKARTFATILYLFLAFTGSLQIILMMIIYVNGVKYSITT